MEIWKCKGQYGVNMNMQEIGWSWYEHVGVGMELVSTCRSWDGVGMSM